MVRIKAYERQLEKLLEVYEEEEKEDNSPKIDMDAEELADGKIIEHGTFETLIDKHAAFYDFYQLKK